MKRLLVLGAGTAGTMVVNKLRPLLPPQEWEITVVEPAASHLYQPGLLFVPFGRYEPDQLLRPTRPLLPTGVELITEEVDRIDVENDLVELASGRTIDYDQLVIATGTHARPDMTPGMVGPQLGDTVHEFYTLPGAQALRKKLEQWEGGRFVVHITEVPIKCPVAPLEFAFLADDFFRTLGIRDRVEMTFATPFLERSPNQSRPTTLETCWKSEGSPSNPISTSNESTRGLWCPTTSGSSRLTYW